MKAPAPTLAIEERRRLQGVWGNMRRRCYDRKDVGYQYYGKRGVKVCRGWREFSSFYGWATRNGYEFGLTLDRRNNDGNYSPQNCRWVTYKEQAGNRRRNGICGPTTVCHVIIAPENRQFIHKLKRNGYLTQKIINDAISVYRKKNGWRFQWTSYANR